MNANINLTTNSITRPNGVLEKMAPTAPTAPTIVTNRPTIIIRTGTRVKVVALSVMAK